MGLYYACPHCQAPRKVGDTKDGNKTTYYYECGTELDLTKEGTNFLPYWKPVCQYKVRKEYYQRSVKK
jgi:hypothetical protein